MSMEQSREAIKQSMKNDENHIRRGVKERECCSNVTAGQSKNREDRGSGKITEDITLSEPSSCWSGVRQQEKI